jgi:hypothetical protein
MEGSQRSDSVILKFKEYTIIKQGNVFSDAKLDSQLSRHGI